MDVLAQQIVESATDREPTARWRLICVSATEPRWTALAMQLAEANLPHPRIEWVDSASLLMQCLRNDRYDAIVIEHPAADEDATIKTRQLIAGLRGGGHQDAVVVLIASPADDLLASVANHDGEALVSLSPWESPALLPTIQRAIRLAELQRTHRELEIRHARRAERDRDEAEQILRRQQALLTELIQPPLDSEDDLAESLRRSYLELLQTQVTREAEPNVDDLRELAAAFVAADFPPREALGLHVAAVRQMITVLGEPSSRQILSRADRLALELMVHLAEGYQRPTAS